MIDLKGQDTGHSSLYKGERCINNIDKKPRGAKSGREIQKSNLESLEHRIYCDFVQDGIFPLDCIFLAFLNDQCSVHLLFSKLKSPRRPQQGGRGTRNTALDNVLKAWLLDSQSGTFGCFHRQKVFLIQLNKMKQKPGGMLPVAPLIFPFTPFPSLSQQSTSRALSVSNEDVPTVFLMKTACR